MDAKSSKYAYTSRPSDKLPGGSVSPFAVGWRVESERPSPPLTLMERVSTFLDTYPIAELR